MKHIPIILSTLVATAATAVAQNLPLSSTLPRGETRLTDNYIDVNTHGWGTWRHAAPKQRLPAGTSGTVPTAQVCYASYMDSDLQGNTLLQFRRSINGGFTWLPAQTVHTLATGELLSAPETRLVAFEHEVYLVWASNAHNLSNGAAQGVWACGSADQGQTWTAPALLSTGVLTNLYDVDEINAAVSQLGSGGAGFLNVVYEADYATPASGFEDIYHVQAQIVGNNLLITSPETRLNHAFPIASADVNFTDIVAQGPVIHVCYTQKRVTE